MNPQNLVREFNKDIDGHLPRSTSYKQVTVCLTYWEDNDLPGCSEEVGRLHRLFQEQFKYTVRTFVIPSQRPEPKLCKEIADFTDEFSVPSSLIIFYYAGHGEPEENGRARWAAAEAEDSPILNWFHIQPVLFSGDGDVLILLDCCHASIASKDSRPAKSSRKIEILAASAEGQMTPAPGRLSFTAVITRQLQVLAKRDEAIAVTTFHARLALSQSELIATPQYFDLSGNSEESILLRIWRPPLVGFIHKPTHTILLNISLSKDITGSEIARWLKSRAPESLSGVNIEAVVLRSLQAQSLRTSAGTFVPGSRLSQISLPAQAEILEKLAGLKNTISHAEKEARAMGGREEASQTMQALEQTTSDVYDTIEKGLILDPSFQEEEALEGLQKEDVTAMIGAEKTIQLRKTVLGYFETTTDLVIQRSAVRFTGRREWDKNRFRLGKVAQKPVLLEYLTYLEKPQLTQAQKIITLLRNPKCTDFHILPGVGYTAEPDNDKVYAITYELPPTAPTDQLPSTLNSLYRSMKKIVTIESRIMLARSLSIALDNLHSTGWLHKSINSENICFLINETAECKNFSVDLDRNTAYIFGFDFVRLQIEGTSFTGDDSLVSNVHHDPVRWGKPSVPFTKAHDVYSLGVVLIEIALWHDLTWIFPHLKEDWRKQQGPITLKNIPTRFRKDY